MKIVLDTNFMISCVRQKIDFISQLNDLFPLEKMIIFTNVIRELESLSGNGELKLEDRNASSLVLQILEKNRDKIKSEDASGEVDDSIVSYAGKNKSVVVGTLDAGIMRRIGKKARILIIKRGSQLSMTE